MISKQDECLAKAAIQLYKAVEHACAPSELTDEDEAEYVCKTVEIFMESYDTCAADDSQAIAHYVYDALGIDIGKIV